MNARIQVEHTVTEMRTDIDLVREQLRIMQEGTLSLTQDDVHFMGMSLKRELMQKIHKKSLSSDTWHSSKVAFTPRIQCTC